MHAACVYACTCMFQWDVWVDRPDAGYWTHHELAGYVVECSPPSKERCLGTRLSTCGSAYQGTMCSACKPNHHVDDQACVPCNAAETRATANINTVFKVSVTLVLLFLIHGPVCRDAHTHMWTDIRMDICANLCMDLCADMC